MCDLLFGYKPYLSHSLVITAAYLAFECLPVKFADSWVNRIIVGVTQGLLV